MWLYFSLCYSQGKNRSCRLYSNELEHLMEVLNYFAGSGCRLLSAFLVDNEGKRTDLPLTAFDGLPVTSVMHGLEREYQRALTTPLCE
ncbi:hypothetical protein [Larkinella sp. C7]|jgi:hypothetical protein|uniref:hypothetical protein n=1 Tax=Larkinella sp. C7 TaxID=2576607 RepID=UPI0011112262|nr:hypothetical protein [Larkinella sp. C7]